MFSQTIDRLHPGDVLGKTIYAASGTPLLIAGTPLTARFIEALRSRGVMAVHLRDGLADDVLPDSIVSDRVRTTITGHIATMFSSVAMLATERGMGTGGVHGACGALGELPLDMGPDGDRQISALYADVELLITEILEGDTVAGLESLKTHNDYTFQHSVDVAVIGVVLGKRMGMQRTRLRELALGCLLHDIGKIYIDQAILDKPGELTGEEFEAIKEHPRMGFELVRRMPVASLLPAHVAYQHHERQRGAGYPRGLVGDNRVADRIDHERIGAGRMLLLAEIGAVADVYSALSSDRPYRAAMPPDQITAVLERMAGPHLNRELVDKLRQIVPSFPVGRWVEVTSGRHAGGRGVVSHVPAGGVDRPTVRLLLDAAGESLASPYEVDARHELEFDLRCVPAEQIPTQRLIAAS
jgi:HD-GYP domain-containing protein (c-di-GMP phosphodiesterase class II)